MTQPVPADPASDPHRWKALAVLCLAVSIVTLDNTILNVALPTLAREVDASTSQLQWIVEAFVLALAACLLTGGAVGDRVGRRRLLVVGCGVFGAASILAALCATAGQLIAARALLGIGAAGIMPATLSSIRSIFPEHERTRAIGIWTAASSLGIVLGPVIGGALLEWFSWPAIFLVNLPVVTAVLVTARWIPETRSSRKPGLDLVGAGLSATGLLLVVYAVIDAPHVGWTSSATLGLGALGIATLVAFVVWEARVAEPLLDLALLRSRRFSIASLSVAMIYVAFGGVLFAITQYLQLVLGYGSLEAGLRLGPLVLGFLLLSPLTGRLAAAVGAKWTIVLGLTLAAAGLAVLASVELTSSYLVSAGALFIFGVGTGLAAPAAVDSVMGATPAEHAGSGAALDETLVELGQAFGVAVLGSVLAAGYAGGLGRPAGVPGRALDGAQESIGAAEEIAVTLGGSAGAALLDAARRALVEGMTETALVGAGICVAAALVVAALLPGRSPGAATGRRRT